MSLQVAERLTQTRRFVPALRATARGPPWRASCGPPWSCWACVDRVSVENGACDWVLRRCQEPHRVVPWCSKCPTDLPAKIGQSLFDARSIQFFTFCDASVEPWTYFGCHCTVHHSCWSSFMAKFLSCKWRNFDKSKKKLLWRRNGGKRFQVSFGKTEIILHTRKDTTGSVPSPSPHPVDVWTGAATSVWR